MSIDEVVDEFQGMREEFTYNIIVLGEYILTESSFLNYEVDFPVIQIERSVTGCVIVAVNGAAFRAGFQSNLFLTNIEKIDFEEIDEFLNDGGGEKPTTTRFRLVMLGRQNQDVQERDEELLAEALSDDIPVLDNTFWNKIK